MEWDRVLSSQPLPTAFIVKSCSLSSNKKGQVVGLLVSIMVSLGTVLTTGCWPPPSMTCRTWSTHVRNMLLPTLIDPNPDKCKTKLMALLKTPRDLPCLKLCGTNLPWVNKVKHLGNTISSTLWMETSWTWGLRQLGMWISTREQHHLSGVLLCSPQE